MRYILTLFAFLILSTHVFAAEVVTVRIKGMVCDFCAQSVTKVYMKNDDVQNVSVDLDTQTITLNMKDGAIISDDEVKKGVHYAGYDFVDLERTDNE